MSNRFVSGTDGRVRVGSNVVVGGITAWKLSKKTTPIPIPHFESATDGDGNVWPDMLVGLSGATGSVEGLFDTDATNTTDIGTPGISNGLVLTLDLMISKANTWGFYNISALVDNFEITMAVENQPAKFSFTFTVKGNPGKSSGTAS